MKNTKKQKHSGKHKSIKRKHVKTLHIIKVFTIYLIMTVAFSAWLEVSSYGDLNPILLAIVSLLTAIVATFFHWKRRQHNKVDDIAEGKL